MNNKNEFEVIELAMNNAYKFLMGGEDWSKMREPIVWMPMNKEQADLKEIKTATEEDFDSYTTIDILIDYFTGTEEYEKCAELARLKRIRKARNNSIKS